MPRPLARTLRALLYTLATFVILWLALIEAPLYLTRLHVSHLLADFQSIRPMQSNWADAQRLMTRWHRWGHSDGPCTTASCDYRISIDDPITKSLWYGGPLHRLANEHVFHAIEHLGWHMSRFYIGFKVKDGTIVGLQSGLGLGPPAFDEDTLLILTTDMKSRLGRTSTTMSNGEQLDDHPDYEVGRPGGCTFCELEKVTYTSFLAHAEFVRLTSYNLSCITRIHSCQDFAQILPSARDWHLYDNDYNGPDISGGPGPVACRTEPRARGRDAEIILEADARASEITTVHYYPNTSENIELSRIRVVRVIKGSIAEKPGDEMLIHTFSGVPDTQPPLLPESLISGHRYFLFLDPDYERNFSELKYIEADRCGVLDSIPANLTQINLGISQDVPAPDTFFPFF